MPHHGSLRDPQLDEVLEAVRELRDEIRQRWPVAPAGPAVGLVAAIAATVGGRTFTSRELLAHARLEPDLQTALAAALLEGPRELGIALAALEGRAAGGLTLARIGATREGIRWAVRVFPAQDSQLPDCDA